MFRLEGFSKKDPNWMALSANQDVAVDQSENEFQA